MRLGELLVQRGVVTGEQVRAALHAQQNYGERLGTNLVQLGYLDLDVLGRALGEQRSVPAAQRRHVASLDKRILAIFSSRTVTSYKAIPLGYTQTKPARVIVACADPSALPVEEIAFAAGSRVDLWIAPELLIQECLEKYYAVAPKPSRYLEVTFNQSSSMSSSPPMMGEAPEIVSRAPPPPRAPSGSPAPPPVLDPPTARPSVRSPASPPSPPPQARTSLLSPPPPPPAPSISQPPPQSAPRPVSASPRPVPVLEMPPVPPPVAMPSPVPPPALVAAPPVFQATPVAPASVTPAQPPRAVSEAPAVSRRGVRRDYRAEEPALPSDDGWDEPAPAPARQPAPEPHAEPSSPDVSLLRPVIDQAAATRMIEMATSKEQVGRVLADWLRSTFGCGMVLIVKNEMAIGWKGFFPDAEDLIEAVSVPLGKPSIFSKTYETQRPFFGSPTEDGAKTNQLFWKLLRCAPPYEVLVCPVVLARRTVNLIYAHPDGDNFISDTNFRQAQLLASNASDAYMRFIKKDRVAKSGSS